MNDNIKLVDFKTYCTTCKYKEVVETLEPCDSCLSIPAREGSVKPEKWEAKE